jgi:predicted dehydrogenase
VEKYQLGNDVACYEDPESLASDKNVDMVAVSVKVPTHYGFIKPALEAKKEIFVEWPLAANLKEAEELTALAHQAGVRNIVGLQARQNPSIVRAKQMVENGELGEILGTTMYGSGMVLGATEAPVYEYMADIDNGANMLTIPVGHAMDAMCYVLGEMSELSAKLAIRRPTMDIVDPEGKVLRTVQKTSHDWMSVSGTLQKSGGVVTVVYQGGVSDTGKDFYWEINGTKGTLVLEAPKGHIQMFHPTIKFVKFGDGSEKLKEIEVEPAKDFAYNVGKAWDAVIGEGHGSVVTFEDALLRHKMIEAIYRSNESGRRESYL